MSAGIVMEERAIAELVGPFLILEKSGIVSRHDFSCCPSCGHAAMQDEIEAGSIGYVFYHAQSTDSARESGHVFLNWGAVNYPAVQLGNRIVKILRSHGLQVSWEGSEN